MKNARALRLLSILTVIFFSVMMVGCHTPGDSTSTSSGDITTSTTSSTSNSMADGEPTSSENTGDESAVDGTTTNGTTTAGSSVSGNEVSGNSGSGNNTSGNKTSGNSGSGNKTSGNTGSGNKTTVTTGKTTATTKNSSTGTELKGGASVKESHLSNAYKHLVKGTRKLTLGYLGGSITLGTSAQSDGTLADSWVNLTTAWFKKQYPNTTIESVNAGVSDTGTNFGLFRLEQCLMNTNGHDMPDVVFVEFCNNDWINNSQTKTHLEGQIESLFRNIYALNPYAEIVVVSTARGVGDVRTAYRNVAKKYDIPVVDVGMALSRAIKNSGHTETSGDYYYTTDNLHPSAKGYHVYFEVIEEFLNENLSDLKLQSELLYDYASHMPAVSTKYYINSPKIHTADSLTLSGSATKMKIPLSLTMFGTSETKTSRVDLTSSMVYINGKATIETTFNGSVLGLMFQMNSNDIELTYSVDGGAEKSFVINSGSYGFQRYDHPQVFMLGHDFGAGAHKLKITFSAINRTYLAGILSNAT